MKQRALITGASSGIGLELARLFADDGYDLVLVARSKKKLEDLANELEKDHKLSVVVMVKDLAKAEAPQEIFDELKKRKAPIEVLVNNAGFGYFGSFDQEELEEQEDMIQVNITALTALTRLFAPGMIKRGAGKILNVASTAAFQPGPLSAVYFASKAYVLSFSEAIANELKEHDIVVSCLCPGPTDTGFQKRANRIKSKLFANKAMTAVDVARQGYDGLMNGKSVVIATKPKGRFLIFLQRFAPKSYIVKTTRKLLEGISPSQKRKN